MRTFLAAVFILRGSGVGKIVHHRVLDQGAKDEHKTRDQVNVDSPDVGDRREAVLVSHQETGQREDRDDGQGHPGRGGLRIDPEADPGEHDDEGGGQVPAQDVEVRFADHFE